VVEDKNPVNAKSFAKLVAMIAISVVAVTLLLGGGKDANSFGYVGSLVALFLGIPAIVVITLFRYVEKRDHGR
jgi:hypothetical protein